MIVLSKCVRGFPVAIFDDSGSSIPRNSGLLLYFLICSAALYSLRQHASMVTSWMVTSSCGHPWWESLRVCDSIYIYIWIHDHPKVFLGAQHFTLLWMVAKSCTNRMVFRPYEYWDVYHQLVQDFAGPSTVLYMPQTHTHVVMVTTD